MLELKLFRQYFKTEVISCAAMVYAFSCISIDTYFIYIWATYLFARIFRLFDIFVGGLQINHLNGFQLFFNSNALIVHLDMQLYLLLLYLFVLNYNTINLYRDIDKAVQQVVAIRLKKCHCINKIYPRQSIYNLDGYSITSNIIHGRKTIIILKNRDKTKMEKNDTDVNSVIKLIQNQLFSILFDSYVMFLGVLFYGKIWMREWYCNKENY